MNDSHLKASPDGRVQSYIGEDSTRLFQAKVVKQGLRACKLGMRLSRNATPTTLFALTKQFTGKSYKRGQYDIAIADLDIWINTMTLALPIETTGA